MQNDGDVDREKQELGNGERDRHILGTLSGVWAVWPDC